MFARQAAHAISGLRVSENLEREADLRDARPTDEIQVLRYRDVQSVCIYEKAEGRPDAWIDVE